HELGDGRQQRHANGVLDAGERHLRLVHFGAEGGGGARGVVVEHVAGALRFRAHGAQAFAAVFDHVEHGDAAPAGDLGGEGHAPGLVVDVGEGVGDVFERFAGEHVGEGGGVQAERFEGGGGGAGFVGSFAQALDEALDVGVELLRGDAG